MTEELKPNITSSIIINIGKKAFQLMFQCFIKELLQAHSIVIERQTDRDMLIKKTGD